MALKLDDLLSKKKDPHSQILDLSKVRIRNREEFEKYFDKIPEYKIRPEKVRQEDIRIRDTDFSFRFTKKEAKYISKHTFSYADPVPASMKTVRLDDLAAVDISWRMLTMLRPKNRLEEEIFSRLVELGKLRLATRKFEAKLLEAATSGAPGSQQHAIMASMGIIIMKTKRGGTETRIKTCKECGDELCTGAFCKEFPYESYTRMILDKDELERQEAEEARQAGVGSRRGSKNKAGNNGNAKQAQGKGTKNLTGGKLKGGKLKRKKKKRGKKVKTTKGSSESNSDAE
ncbi:unnamed protein product [Orchesella dallaii]|uniref:Uncharacterized protein n=1 Tax=Orchesella dallaii TaxID=48710 RepID=A0ABP1QEE8_9HEXA